MSIGWGKSFSSETTNDISDDHRHDITNRSFRKLVSKICMLHRKKEHNFSLENIYLETEFTSMLTHKNHNIFEDDAIKMNGLLTIQGIG